MRARRAETPARMHVRGGNVSRILSAGDSAPLATVVSLPTARAARAGAQRRGTPTSVGALFCGMDGTKMGNGAPPSPPFPLSPPSSLNYSPGSRPPTKGTGVLLPPSPAGPPPPQTETRPTPHPATPPMNELPPGTTPTAHL